MLSIVIAGMSDRQLGLSSLPLWCDTWAPLILALQEIIRRTPSRRTSGASVALRASLQLKLASPVSITFHALLGVLTMACLS